MADSTFEALANIPDHISSFAASAQDGKVTHSSTNSLEETNKIASTAYQLLTDATLLSKSPLKRITVTYPNEYHAFSISNDIIYGIKRTNQNATS